MSERDIFSCVSLYWKYYNQFQVYRNELMGKKFFRKRRMKFQRRLKK